MRVIIRDALMTLTLTMTISIGLAAGAAQEHQHPGTHPEGGAHRHPAAAKLKNPVAADATSVAAGKQLYDKQCAGCHGDAGKGDGAMGEELNPKPANLADAEFIKAGARAYATRGCVHCHGAPGVEWSKFSEGLRPDPPDLHEIVDNREPRELFWVIKNGIKMTGMPSFGEIEVPDQEIWSIVAFIKKLPTVKDEDYKAWTEQPASPVTGTTPPAGNP